MRVRDPSKAHAVLSASGSERWLGCPGSVKASHGIVTVDTEWSVKGTHAHTLMQFILENLKWAWLLAQPEAKKFRDFIEYSAEQHAAVMVAVNYVRAEQARMKQETGHAPILHVEKKVELKGVGFGTADVILYHPFGVLHVMDFKNGRSPVECAENTQGLYYAYAAADLYGWDFSEVWITIIQPNATHKAGPIRTWKTTPHRLVKAGIRFRDGAKLTRKPNAPLVMNAKWCWFCPARETCPEHMKTKERNIMDRFKRPNTSDNQIEEREYAKEKSSQIEKTRRKIARAKEA